MEKTQAKERPDAQKKYRRSQSNKGLVRFELQVTVEAKTRFEEMVKAAAEELAQPWDPKRRMAKARRQIFDEITQDVLHEFFELKDQIQSLQAEIQALSPSFFKTTAAEQTPLPEAIRTLPDDPQQLKILLTKTHHNAQQAKQAVRQHKRQAEQFQELYEVSSQYNDRLKERLRKHNIPID